MLESLTANEAKVIEFLADKFFNGDFNKALHATLYEGTLAYIFMLENADKKEYNNLISQQALFGDDK